MMPGSGPVPVTYLITELNIGGAERALERLVLRLDRRRFTPEVWCLFGAGPVFARLRRAGVPTQCLGMRHRMDPTVPLRLAWALRRSQPRIVHSFLFHANLLGRLLGRLLGVPHVVSSERTMELEGPLRRWLNRGTGAMAHRIVVVSEAVGRYAAEVIGLDPSRIRVIPNGVEIGPVPDSAARAAARKLLGLPPRATVIGTVLARMDREKGLDLLIAAAARLPALRSGSAILVVIGGGPGEEAAQARVADLGLDGAVRFTGPREEATTLLPSFDIFVLPSRTEGLSNALLEAMACGLPAVATAVGGTPEAVLHGETGLLVPREDPRALAAALQVLLDDPPRASAMGAAGRRRVEDRFRVERMVEATQELYAELLAGEERK
ncbi:MAG TPA: glycosyltransferase [Candidatus Methylomirabilis sp.]|jgi:starch synthase (maltosyl-transferring)|nr:glycosyltransferase [Candidatus Methylomirabilis sp.]